MIRIKSREQINSIAKSGRIIGEIFYLIRDQIKDGVTTSQLNKWIGDFIRKKGAKSAFKGYRGYPANSCISVNEEVVHGIPSNRKLKKGDIVSIDIGVNLNGYYTDAARTFPVGKISQAQQRLIRVTRKALYEGIEQAKEGNRVGDISFAIQNYVEKHGYSVVKTLFGHGVGEALHEDPVIPNFGQAKKGERLKEGMVLAIEPMVNEGGDKVKVLSDGWTVMTADGSPSAHFEHTVALVNGKVRILTGTRG
ncbi:MAG: type I methionyl aminopeptidase [Candidatus Aerophobetes bacterium]|nr:type I methionyl aminopeptidase [Candidatus Aerophobetes bacterium]